jgi:purine-nucleoside phosphorylase
VNKSKKALEDYFFGSPVCIAEKILFIKYQTRLAGYKEHLANIQEFGQVWQGLTGTLRGDKVTIIATGVGPAQVGDAIYAIDKPGAICLYAGTCGGLGIGQEIGDYFLANQAICADGFSLLFGQAPFSSVDSDEELFQCLVGAFQQRNIPFSIGQTFTTSSVVRENDPDFWELIGSKCQAVEMGCASFYVAARRSLKRAAAYFWITDLPTRGKSFYDPASAEDLAIRQKRFEEAVLNDIQVLSQF